MSDYIINVYVKKIEEVFKKLEIGLSVDNNEIFNQGNAKRIITQILNKYGKDNLYRELEFSSLAPPPDRYNHTLSAFLLGLNIRDKMHIDMKNLPHVVSNNPKDNFLYFWILICLYHDCAYYIENEVDWKICPTVKEFITEYDIKYNFIELSEYRDLFNRYYQYRTEYMHVIDHGIAGALLLYDRLIKLYYNNKNNISGLFFSRDYKKHILLVANTIARHNIFSSNEQTEEIYKRFGLEELIPSTNRFSKVKLDEKSENEKIRLLFLLEFVDTIDPVKVLTKRFGKKIALRYLSETKIAFNYGSNQVELQYPDLITELYSPDINNWLGVNLSVTRNGYVFEFERLVDNDLVA